MNAFSENGVSNVKVTVLHLYYNDDILVSCMYSFSVRFRAYYTSKK